MAAVVVPHFACREPAGAVLRLGRLLPCARPKRLRCTVLSGRPSTGGCQSIKIFRPSASRPTNSLRRRLLPRSRAAYFFHQPFPRSLSLNRCLSLSLYTGRACIVFGVSHPPCPPWGADTPGLISRKRTQTTTYGFVFRCAIIAFLQRTHPRRSSVTAYRNKHIAYYCVVPAHNH